MRRVLVKKLHTPEVLRIVGEEARRNGTHKLTSRQIDKIIQAARARKENAGGPT